MTHADCLCGHSRGVHTERGCIGHYYSDGTYSGSCGCRVYEPKQDAFAELLAKYEAALGTVRARDAELERLRAEVARWHDALAAEQAPFCAISRGGRSAISTRS